MKSKILIVDDSEFSGDGLREIFESDFDIIEVKSGKDAIDMMQMQSENIVTVLLNIVMGEVSGFALLEKINKVPAFKDIPIVVITESTAIEDQARAFELGVSEYLIKPLDKVIALSRVRNLIALHKRMIDAKSQVENLRELSERDEMTGILNKVTTEKNINEILNSSEGSLDVMLVIDIDKFKSINDNYGHQSGDLVIKATADTLIHNFRSTDIFGRIGGDEFCVLMVGMPNKELARQKVDNLLQSVKYSLNSSFSAFATISVGMATNEYKNTTYEELFAKADEALYKAKQNGRAQYREYGVDVDSEKADFMIYNSPEAVLEAMLHFYMDEKNVEATLNCVTDDIQWVATEDTDRACGKEQLKEVLEYSVKEFPYSFGVRIIDLNKQIYNENMVQFLFIVTDDKSAESGDSSSQMKIRMSVCCERTANGWKIKLFHASVASTLIKTYELQKEVDRNLKMEQTLLAGITGGAGIYRLKKDGRLKVDYVTDGVSRLFGYEDNRQFMEYYQNDARVNIAEDDIQILEDTIEKCLKTGRPGSAVYHSHVKNGPDILQRVNANLIDTKLGEDDVAVLYIVHTKVSEDDEREMREQERYRLVLEILNIAYWEWSKENGYYISPRYYDYAISDADQNTVWTVDEYKKYVHPDDLQIMIDFINKDKSTENTAKAIARCKLKDGSYQWTELYSFNEYDKDGNLTMIISAMRAVDEAWVEQKLQLEDILKVVVETRQKNAVELLFDALSNSAENVYIFENDLNKNYSNWSANAVEYFNLSEDYHTNVLTEWVEKIHQDDRQAYLDEVEAVLRGDKAMHHSQYRVKNKYGDFVWVECNGKIVSDTEGKMKLFAGMITRLDNQSKYDPLTKKLSAHQFYLQEYVEKEYTVLLLGMDSFRRIIHSYGYEAGNKMLISLGDELDKPSLNQIVYRMNGDEFLVILPKISNQDVNEYFRQVLSGFQDSCLQHDYAKSITFSGACDTFIPEVFDKETLMKRLEHSMEQAKVLGGGRLIFFSEEIENKHKRVYEISRALEQSISNGFTGFELYYQPILTIDDKKIRTVEALLRFHTDELGWVSPAEFIPILESNRSMRIVGLWVMEEVIKQNKIWNQKYENIKTGFNVSYLQLYNDSLVNRLIELVDEYGVDPELITLELTESCKILHSESLSSMFEKLIDHGFLVALDDFGMENSTLTILRDIPITTVKIDHSFVRTIIGDESKLDKANLAIISGIITMCKKFSYNVVVEGIETKAVAKMMVELGADYLQGFYYSKPIPAAEVETFFE